MAEKHITIEREHSLSLDVACNLAEQWKKSGETDYNLRCTYKSEPQHTIHFKRSGVEGTLVTTETHFMLTAQLGFLLRPYKERIAEALEKNLTEHLYNVSNK